MMNNVSLYVKDIVLKTSVSFTYKKVLMEYPEGNLGAPVEYQNDVVYQGVVSKATEEAIENLRLIDAIKSLRADNVGLGLKEAKDIAQAMQAEYQRQRHFVPAVRQPLEWEVKVLTKFAVDLAIEMGEFATDRFRWPDDLLIANDHKIEYVKALRALNTISLKLAKFIADEVWSVRIA